MLRFLLLIPLAFAVGLGLGRLRPDRSVPHGPMVQNVQTDGFTVVWWDKGSAAGHVSVTAPDRPPLQVDATVHNGRHLATIHGLPVETACRYEFQSQHRQGEGAVRTAPSSPNAPVHFLVFGDSGDGGTNQLNLARTMRAFPVDLILHTGDLVYKKGAWKDYDRNFFVPYGPLLATTPIYPTLGNHDIKTANGEPLLEAFELPANGPAGMQAERCYWFDRGGARFVGLDSNLPEVVLREKVEPWLRQVLSAPGPVWRFVYYHHPVHLETGSLYTRPILEEMMRLFAETRVDIAFCGHYHMYARSTPQVTEGGSPVTYVIEGAGGGELVTSDPWTTPEQVVSANRAGFSFSLVELDGPSLRMRQIDTAGKVIDEFTMTK